MITFINKFVFSPLIAFLTLFLGLSSTPINTFEDSIYNFDYTINNRDSLYNGISWVNSAVKQDGYGFNNFDIEIVSNVTTNPFDPNVGFNVEDIYLSDFSKFLDLPYSHYKFSFTGLDTQAVSISLRNDYDLFTFWGWDGGRYIELDKPDVDVALNELALSLVDRDIKTGFNVSSYFIYRSEEDNNYIPFNFVYSFDINFPTYSYFRSALISKGSFNYEIENSHKLPIDYSLKYSLDSYFSSVNSDHNPLVIGHMYSKDVPTSSSSDSDIVVPLFGGDTVNIYTSPDDLNLQGSFKYSLVSTYHGGLWNNSTSYHFNNQVSIVDSWNEINFFSDDPVIGGFYGGGDVVYENVAWYDIFGHLRNFTRWLFLDSFIYDAISPLLDPIYFVLNQLSVFIYNVLSLFGFMDPYYQTQRQFFVDLLYNLFMVYVIVRFINFF